ncbi:MAG: hypothetical protein Q6370_004080 [Candidatus Sigynarchaeota archaeon]
MEVKTVLINLIDIDGTLCRSIFDNARLKNNNDNCRTGDFIRELKALEPFKWCRHAFYAPVNIIVTGRLHEHEKLTIDWFYENCMDPAHASLDRISFVSVPWDDTKITREASYADYVERKSSVFEKLISEWHKALSLSNIVYELHLYEDDKAVLARLRRWLKADVGLHLHVVENGEVHEYP